MGASIGGQHDSNHVRKTTTVQIPANGLRVVLRVQPAFCSLVSHPHDFEQNTRLYVLVMESFSRVDSAWDGVCNFQLRKEAKVPLYCPPRIWAGGGLAVCNCG